MKFTLRQARTYAGLTQAQAAEATGICRHRYMKIEKDPSTATIAELAKFSEVTGIPFEDLVLLSRKIDCKKEDLQNE